MSDAWRYCENLSDPEAVKKLAQAALTAHATIKFARTQVNPEEFEIPCPIGALCCVS